MKRLAHLVDLADTLILAGVAACAVTVYWLNWVWVPAFVGGFLILWGLLLALAQPDQPGQAASGSPAPGRSDRRD